MPPHPPPAFVTPVRMAQGRAAVDAPRLPVMLDRQRSRERWFVYTLAVVALVLRPATFLAFTLPIWVAGTLIFLGINLLQHDACDPDSATEHSRDFTGRFINFLFFNGGYHTVHHDRPGLHWRRLPAAPRRVVPDREETPSLLGHLLREYLLPRWRTRCTATRPTCSLTSSRRRCSRGRPPPRRPPRQGRVSARIGATRTSRRASTRSDSSARRRETTRGASRSRSR